MMKFYLVFSIFCLLSHSWDLPTECQTTNNGKECCDALEERFSGGTDISCVYNNPTEPVVSLSLRGCSLIGPIPDLNSMSGLSALDLSDNSQDNHIAAGYLSSLTELITIDLSFNQFSGTFPDDLVKLVNLETIDVANNRFTGGLPQFGQDHSLVTLDLENNNFEQTEAFWTSLVRADASEIGVKRIDASGNNFAGSLSTALTSLTHLTFLDLMDNQIAHIPDIQTLSNLMHLDLHLNRLNESFLTLGEMPQLTHLDLAHNYMTGALPINLDKSTDLKYLNISYNYFHGGVPSQWEGLTNLQRVDMSHNYVLGGTLYNAQQLWTKMEYLDLSYNSFYFHDFPPEFAEWTALKYLNLHSNFAQDTLPTWISHLTTLEEIYLGENDIIGPIHDGFEKLTNLKILDLRKNSLTGSIPKLVAEGNQLEEISLGGNFYLECPVRDYSSEAAITDFYSYGEDGSGNENCGHAVPEPANEGGDSKKLGGGWVFLIVLVCFGFVAAVGYWFYTQKAVGGFSGSNKYRFEDNTNEL